MISVIIPVYNMQPYLKDCLDSVARQTFSDLEIICVNDGSTDGSADILKAYAEADKRIKILEKPNGGLSSARNFGLNVAKGEYIAFLDSDDFVAPDYYEKLLNCILKNGADVAASSVYYYYNENLIRKDEWVNYYTMAYSEKRNLILPEEKQGIIYACACWNKLYKASLIKDMRFKEGIYIEDFPFTFECVLKSHKISLEENAVLYYRQRDDSIIKKICNKKSIFDVFIGYGLCDQALSKFAKKENVEIFRQILDNFKVFNLKAYFEHLSKEYVENFYTRMRFVFSPINPQGNPFISDCNREFLCRVKEMETYKDYKNSQICKRIYNALRTIQKNILDIKYHKRNKKLHIKIFGITIFSKNPQ